MNTNHRNYLPGTSIEIINPHLSRIPFHHAVFDFDGTVSLIREGWQRLMISMSVEVLQDTPQADDEAALRQIVADFVTRLTGQPTIYQMIALAQEVERRGGQPKDPQDYKRDYLDRLSAHIEGRVVRLKSGQAKPEEMVVPGVIEVLRALRQKDVICHLASGTDEQAVVAEAEALGVADDFNGGIFGARDDDKTVSKKRLINRILSEHHLSGPELIVFGDGTDEIEHAAVAGSVAVGVASNELERRGINEVKRQQLINVGANIIIPDFREQAMFLAYFGM